MGYIVITIVAAYVISLIFEVVRVILINKRTRRSTPVRGFESQRRQPMHAHYHVIGQGCLVCGASPSERCDAGLHC